MEMKVFEFLTGLENRGSCTYEETAVQQYNPKPVSKRTEEPHNRLGSDLDCCSTFAYAIIWRWPKILEMLEGDGREYEVSWKSAPSIGKCGNSQATQPYRAQPPRR